MTETCNMQAAALRIAFAGRPTRGRSNRVYQTLNSDDSLNNRRRIFKEISTLPCSCVFFRGLGAMLRWSVASSQWSTSCCTGANACELMCSISCTDVCLRSQIIGT